MTKFRNVFEISAGGPVSAGGCAVVEGFVRLGHVRG